MELISSIEDLDSVTKKIKVHVPANELIEKYNISINNLVLKTKIKGFRPGKAPKDMIEKMYGNEVSTDVARKLIESTLDIAIKNNNIESLGIPNINIESLDIGSEFVYTADIFIAPKPLIKDYNSLQ